jgi:hypothetical protein
MAALPSHLPDYDGAWIGGIVPGVLQGAQPPWFPAAMAGADAVVLLVLDGLGWRMVREHAAHLPVLASMEGAAITTVAPSTTAAGLTSIVTGLTPSEHGVVGYRMRVGGEVLNVLQWRTAAGERGPDPVQVQPHAGFCGRAVPVVTRAAFDGTGFTQAHLRTGRLDGWAELSDLVANSARAVAEGAPLVYAYYDGVDKVAHDVGLRHEDLAAELAVADRLVADLLDALPPTCALAVTADHGHVHVGPAGMRDLGAVAQLASAYSGEGRFRSLHAGPGAAKRLREVALDAYGHEAWVLTRDEVWASGLLGPPPSPTVRGRIGDVVLLAREDVAYVAPDALREATLMGCHGSITPAELDVPLVAARGRSGT